jgi:aminoglycoside phosphotransferase (APT) family kinase protein
MSSTLGDRRHADRLVSAGRFADRDVVVKHYEIADAAAVYADMAALWVSPFGATRTPPGMPEPIARDVQTVTMSAVEGDTLGVRGDPRRTGERVGDLAQLIADFHASSVVVPRSRTASKLLRSLARKRDGVGDALRADFDRALTAVTAIAPASEELVVSHGDMSPRNVMESPHGLVLIDFDRLQMAGRGRDVAYLGAWMWATSFLDGGHTSWNFADRFAIEYARRAGLARAELDATAAFHRAAALLRIGQSWSSLAAQPDAARTIVAEAERIALREMGVVR